jgi:hypothetical protein
LVGGTERAYRESNQQLRTRPDGGNAVYIEDDDDTGHDMKVVVDGHEYTAEETESYHHDGTTDTAVVDSDDGGHIGYTDTDHDGQADLATTYDSHGNVTEQNHFDAATGKWTKVDHPGSGSSGEMITVDTEHGEQNVGPATADTSNSGHADTAVVTDEQGNTWMYTDSDGDGKADYSMEIATDGQVTISEHTGEHQWTQIEHGHIDKDGNYQKDSGSSHKAASADDEFWGEPGSNPLSDSSADTVW